MAVGSVLGSGLRVGECYGEGGECVRFGVGSVLGLRVGCVLGLGFDFSERMKSRQTGPQKVVLSRY